MPAWWCVVAWWLQGFISPAELYTFFKEIHHMWVHVMHEYADLAVYDVVDEIIDMIKAKVPTQVRCGAVRSSS